MSRLWVAAFAVFLLLARLIVIRLRGAPRNILFALLNAGFFFVYFHPAEYVGAAYLVLVLLCYATLHLFAGSPGWKPWMAFFTPIAALIAIRYIFPPAYSYFTKPAALAQYGIPQFLGISYLAFRNSHLVLEVRNGVVKKPGFWAYLGYSFFFPTMFVGPINPYSNFSRGLADTPAAIPLDRSAMRLLVGLVKFEFLGNIFNRLSYAGLLQDDHYHHWMDLPIAGVFYYFYLYCNFSGFCDVAIGAAGLIGIPVAENFQNPFAARNMKDFWNRWHITLSQYMRDVFFAPVSKFFVRLFGPANVDHGIALTIFLVFILIGIWHGTGWHWVAFGAVNALGVVGNYYYTVALKKWLGRDGFKAYNSNRWIHAGAVALTFWYVVVSLFFFANTFPEMKEILNSLR
jgi:D-alanyl-lipoteichoic acid acyltransferase DltB (MBOAT superfamily)